VIDLHPLENTFILPSRRSDERSSVHMIKRCGDEHSCLSSLSGRKQPSTSLFILTPILMVQTHAYQLSEMLGEVY